MTQRHQAQGITLLLLLVFVLQGLTTTLGFSIDDNRIDLNNLGAAAPSSHVPPVINPERRMFALCPPHFHRVGGACYSVSEQRSGWLEAHFLCKDKDAKLAEPQEGANRKLINFLQRNYPYWQQNDSFWIGATYDWQRYVWQWSISGKDIQYNTFDQTTNLQNLENHCAVYDPTTNYRWAARLCIEKQRFICQHKMPRVSGLNRHKVYERWNATYPNEYANEFLLKIIDRHSRNKNRLNPRLKNRLRHHLRHPQHSPEQLTVLTSSNENQQQKSQETTTKQTISRQNIYNAIQITDDSGNNRTPEDHHHTYFDRKLQRQRERERRRLQRKREKQIENQQRKLLRQQLQQQREHDQNQQYHVIAPENLVYSTTTTTPVPTTTRQSEVKPVRAENSIDRDDISLRALLQHQQQLNEQYEKEREERKRKEADERAKAERIAKEEREEHDRRLQREYEEALKRTQSEQEQRRLMELEAKRQHDLENRQRLEQEAAEKAKHDQLAIKEEELRLEQKRIEDTKRLEEMELERLRKEEEHLLQVERKRQEDIARLEEEKQRIDAEEERIRQEQDEETRHREEALRAFTSTTTQKTTVRTSPDEHKLNARILEENERVREMLEQKRRNYAERIARLPLEAQKKFFELRKQRKTLKDSKKQQQQNS